MSIFDYIKKKLKKIVSLFLLVFYSFGTFCLPLSDFSVLQDLPAMYRHCKANEDKDMTPIDFVTDHLVNIDGLFDKHDKGDEQKPHTPPQNLHHSQSNISFVTYFYFSLANFSPEAKRATIHVVEFLPCDHNSEIFRPPIAA